MAPSAASEPLNSRYKVASPQRVKKLYLLLYEIYQEAVDGNEGEKKVANYLRYNFTKGSLLLQPQGWSNPDIPFRYGPRGMYSKKRSMPLPAEWNTTPSERNLIARFYEEVLRFGDVTTYTVILDELKLYRTKVSKGIIGRDTSNLYQGLEDLDVCGRDRERMIQEFKNHPYIFFFHGSLEYHRQFIWSHGVKLPNQIDPSRQYPHLKSFFVDRLDIPELTTNVLQKQILELADDAPAYDQWRRGCLTQNPHTVRAAIFVQAFMPYHGG